MTHYRQCLVCGLVGAVLAILALSLFTANRNQADADREAATQAQWRQMTTPSNKPTTGGKIFRGGE